MKMFDKKISLGLIVGSRGFFNGAMALDARREVTAQLDKLGIGYHILPVSETNNGAVEMPDDVRKYVQLFDDKSSKGTRTKISTDGDQKVRVGAKSGTKFPTAGMS